MKIKTRTTDGDGNLLALETANGSTTATIYKDHIQVRIIHNPRDIVFLSLDQAELDSLASDLRELALIWDEQFE